MKAIQAWIEKGCDFDAGVEIYKSLPHTKTRVLRSLAKGKTKYNRSLLIKELRQYNNAPAPQPTKVKSTTPRPVQPVTDAIITKEKQEDQYKETSLKREYGQIKYADLPDPLRFRYRELGKIFYQMCDLKFILNDLPAKEEKRALDIVLQIDELDSQRQMIWNEIDHWNTHKLLLPSEANKYDGLNSDELRTEKAKLASNITRIQKRVDDRYKKLFETKNKSEATKIENSIQRSEAKIHQYKLNILKINELL